MGQWYVIGRGGGWLRGGGVNDSLTLCVMSVSPLQVLCLLVTSIKVARIIKTEYLLFLIAN